MNTLRVLAYRITAVCAYEPCHWQPKDERSAEGEAREHNKKTGHRTVVTILRAHEFIDEEINIPIY